MTSRPVMPESDTPETDALYEGENATMVSWLEFARSIERRLAQAQTRIAEIEKELETLRVKHGSA